MNTSIETKSRITLFFIRVALGVVILGHGVQKLLGWFGGFGFEGTMNYFTNTVGLPYVLGFLIIICESFGMVALVFGLFSRIVSASLIIIITGAFFVDHLQYGFFMDWLGAKAGEGFEFDILVVAMASAILVNGGGAFSLDAWLLPKLRLLKNKNEALA
jgi:putative oxidoreductase